MQRVVTPADFVDSTPVGSAVPRRVRRLPPLALLYSAAALAAFFALPFLMLLRVSLARRDPSVYQGTGLTLEGYTRLADPLVTNAILNTLGLALVVATISILIAVPATYLISRMDRRPQVAWLLGLLTTLALSEVLVTFSWQVLLSRRAGLSNILVWLGLFEEPLSLSPSYGALVACLVYVASPSTCWRCTRVCRALTRPIWRPRVPSVRVPSVPSSVLCCRSSAGLSPRPI